MSLFIHQSRKPHSWPHPPRGCTCNRWLGGPGLWFATNPPIASPRIRSAPRAKGDALRSAAFWPRDSIRGWAIEHWLRRPPRGQLSGGTLATSIS